MHRIKKSQVVVMLSTLGVLAFCLLGAKPGRAASGQSLLTGVVKTESGEIAVGAAVSAKAEDSTITTSVFTDDQGNYFFPKTLTTGKYRVWAQTEGFETGHAEATLAGVVHQDFTLKKLKDFSKQFTGAEYLAALPEDTPHHRRMKDIFQNNCTGCHEASYILQNRFDERGWDAVITLMSKLENGGGNYGGPDQPPFPTVNYYKKELAAYLAEMRGPHASPMQFQAHPGPKGVAAMTVTTEFDVPIADADHYSSPNGFGANGGSDWSLGTPSRLNGVGGVHDTQMDWNGNLWFTYAQPSFARSIGMVDAKTGKLTTIKVPGFHGMAAFTHGLAIDHTGMLWFTAAGAGVVDGGVDSLAKIDPNTLKFEVYPPPKNMSGVTLSVDEDAKGFIWASTAHGAVRFDPKTQQYTEFKSVTQTTPEGTTESYGVTGDSDGNGWWAQMFVDRVGKGEVSSGKSFEVKMPPHPALSEDALTPDDRKVAALSGVFMSDFSGFESQGPRRMGADKNGDAMWVCNYWGGNLAKIDIHTLKTTIYPYPTRESAIYAAVVDRNHNVWVNLFNGDSVAKFDPKTEKWTEYPLPTRGIEMRHVAIAEHDGDLKIVLSEFRVGKLAVMQFRTKEELQALRAEAGSAEQLADKSKSSGAQE
jgi:virginiamycin B lyase